MNPSFRASSGQIVRFNAFAACDGTGLVVHQPSLIAQYQTWPSLRILALGTPQEVDHHPANAAAEVRNLTDSVLFPALANPHTHLDLTHIGPQPHDPAQGFVMWVDMVRSRRHIDPAAIAASVRRGVEFSLAGGVVAIGDIAGAPSGVPSSVPYRTLCDSPIRGVSYLEFFGIGNSIDKPKDKITRILDEADGANAQVSLGLQPHAPNTVDFRLYLWAAQLANRRSLRLSTHLAETPEEKAFITRGEGPQRHFLERMGIWDDSILDCIGKGRHPVLHLEEVFSLAPFLAAHVNDADDAAIEILARTDTSVVYCPRASAYFGVENQFGPHRYQDMLRAGINVCLGTDSIINLANPDCISNLDDARFLFRRSGTDALTLLRMITLNAAAALNLDSRLFQLQTGQPVGGLVAVPVNRLGEPGGHPFSKALEAGNASRPVLL